MTKTETSFTIMTISMQKPTKYLDHGNHNEEANEYLELRKEKFADWVITTAFYSALHFVSYKIFPFEVRSAEGEKKLITNIDEYKRSMTNGRDSKHTILAELIRKNCSDISKDYNWLLAKSMNARYEEYQQPTEYGNRARTLMKRIKTYCTRKEFVSKK